MVLVSDAVAVALLLIVTDQSARVAVAYAAVALLTLVASPSSRPGLAPSVAADLPGLAMAVAAAFTTTVVTVGVPVDPAVLVLGGVAALAGSRKLAHRAILRARRLGLGCERTLLVGSAEATRELGAILDAQPEHGLRLVDVVERPASSRSLRERVERSGATRVIAVVETAEDLEAIPALRAASGPAVRVQVQPRRFDLALGSTTELGEELWGHRLLTVRPSAAALTTWRWKRAIDVAASALVLALVAPLMGVVALTVRATGPGPILFRQRRVGQHGQDFTMLKFRTLRPEPALVDLREGLQDTDIQDSRQRDVDGRVTTIGRILRATSLDELPQLWNVLRGDMSLVGPRPEEQHFASVFAATVPGYEDRHRLPVGLTGWAQVHGLRGDTSIVDRARFDNVYIDHWSLRRDLSIAVRTVAWFVRRLLPGVPSFAHRRRS